jgi:hypothetical protein
MVASAQSVPGCDDGSSNNNSTMLDTVVWQPPQTHGSLTATKHQQQPESQLLGAYSCWSDQSSFQDGLYAEVGLPDLEFGGDTMWGACADDDLWYTQMLGL